MVPPDPPLVLRPARREDIPDIVTVALTSAEPSEEAGFGTALEGRTFTDMARLDRVWADPNRVGSEEVLVAVLEGHAVAYVTVEDRGPDLELVNIDVARAYQRRGIGTRLVGFVEDRASREGKAAVTLGTSRNAAGVPWKSFSWWRSLGYHVTHEEENTWTRAIGPGTREIRMRKDLRSPPRVALRPVRKEDLDVLFEVQRDPTANRMAAFTARDPSDRPAFEAHWERILSDPQITMRTILCDGRVVGNVGRFHSPESQKPEVTYWIDRAMWGRGIATRALAEFLTGIAERPLYAAAAADNAGSIRVLEKCGFVLVGRSRAYAHARGQETDEVRLRLDAPAPEARSPPS